MANPRKVGAFAPYTPNEKFDIRYMQKTVFKHATIPGRCKDCRYWNRNEERDTEFGVCIKFRGISVSKHEDGFCDKWRGI